MQQHFMVVIILCCREMAFNQKPRGGRRWFAVESKSFELLIDEVGGKLRGCIWEICKGITSWIRFGDASLSSLLAGVESCCRDRDDRSWSLIWDEEGRKYRMERRSSEAVRFLLCSVRDLEAKRFCLIFLEGKGLSRTKDLCGCSKIENG